ncbi:hypothetical protein CoNPh17_CDS0125 [Staphylococcus phage S-CoN_Ph17]|nr:hypothetical protein CoNPh17_CDS0125 [Staphylococcus phage S-CoN_Ph17]
MRAHISSNGNFYIKTLTIFKKMYHLKNDYQTNIKVVPYAENY